MQKCDRLGAKMKIGTKKTFGAREREKVAGADEPSVTASAAHCSYLLGRGMESNCDIAFWLGIAIQCSLSL